MDETFELLAKAQKEKQASMSFLQAPVYNIDDMDRRECMISLDYSGCYCIRSSKSISSDQPGMVYIESPR